MGKAISRNQTKYDRKKEIRAYLRHKSGDTLVNTWLQTVTRLNEKITPTERDFRQDELLAIEGELNARERKIVWVQGLGYAYQYITDGNASKPTLPRFERS